jgi:type IV pilus assembly protein PilY1
MKTRQLIGSLLPFPRAFALGATLAALAYPAQAAVTPWQTPLFLTSAVKPNIMLMLDNSGSMSNIVPETPYDPNTTYIASCTGTNLVPAGTSVDIQIVSSQPQIRYSSNNYVLGTATGQRCFGTASTYGARLNATAGTSPASSYLDADYSGNYLNWYFNANNTTPTWTSGQQKKPGTLSRIEIAKTSAKNLVDSLSNVRLGLSTYNTDDGGSLREIIGDVDAAKKTAVKAKIDLLTASGMTPLAETLSDIGRYFATGATGSLTLHPGKSNQTTASVNTVFSNHNLTNDSGQTIVNPIQYSCQKSFVVLMTDGRPQSDRAISASLRDYTGNCAASPSQCDATPNTTNLPSSPLTVTTFQNGTKVGRTYEAQGSDYLDDVAQGLFEMDLRPDLSDSSGGKNNIVTYTIGFADTTVASDPLLSDTAIKGGGLFISAANSTELATAFQTALTDITSKDRSASAVSTNSTRLDTSSVVYQATFDSSDWSGQLLAFDVNNTEDLNGNGVLDAGEDANGNSVLDTGNGTIGTQLWDASASGKIPAAASRNVVTYNPSATAAPRGVDFLWANLTATQQAALNANTTIGSGVTAGNVGQKTLDYIRGDQAQEQTTGPFRKRTVILGDIVNSDPWFVGSEDFGYGSLPGTEGSSYVTFRNGSTYQQRRRMLYFGANDGMLHGIDAGSYSSGTFNTGTGAEKLAYVPDAVIPNLKNLTSPSYTHQYFVDGSPKVGDAYISSAWKTVLLGTTGAGGKAVFALDVTAPDSFGSSNVLWEISTTTSPTASDRTTDNTSVAGFQNNLGYTLPQPSLVRMYDGSWAAIVANGYGSANNKAVLYIINAATGNLIRSIDTRVGSSTAGSENGLSTPIALDVDNDRITDYIYAGDLKGNLWKFDVTNSNPNHWDVAYKSGSTPKPLYVACTSSSTPCASANLQPITAKPQVGKMGAGQPGGLMVYFGTGKYFEIADTSTTQTQTFYGIWDKCDKTSPAGCNGQVSGRGSLQQQAITEELAQGGFNLRVTSNCTVNYGSTPLSGAVSPPCTTTANRLGWYMDFIQPASSNLPANSNLGERVVSAPILRDGRIIFTTLIPSPSTDPCTFGGTGWLMELGSTSGQRLGSALWDINGDGKINSNDLVTSGGSSVAPSGKQSKVGIIETPGIISAGTQEYKYTSGSTGNLEVTLESAGVSTGRKAWRQLR